MLTQRIFVIAVALAAAIGLGFVLGHHRGEDLNVSVVRTYNIPPDRGEELKAQLNSLFRMTDDQNLGRVQVFPNGLMIVRAPEGFQRGVASLIDQLDRAKPVPRNVVRFELWVVTGQEDKASNAESVPGLSEPLASIAKYDGNRKFHVLEHIVSNEASGQEAKVKGPTAEVISTAFVHEGLVNLKLDIHGKLGDLRSDMQVTPGEFVVMGQNSADSKVQDGKITNGTTNVYYIVRTEVLK